jgi:hypothetical protein
MTDELVGKWQSSEEREGGGEGGMAMLLLEVAAYCGGVGPMGGGAAQIKARLEFAGRGVA